jgi:hypothetical protein
MRLEKGDLGELAKTGQRKQTATSERRGVADETGKTKHGSDEPSSTFILNWGLGEGDISTHIEYCNSSPGWISGTTADEQGEIWRERKEQFSVRKPMRSGVGEKMMLAN